MLNLITVLHVCYLIPVVVRCWRCIDVCVHGLFEGGLVVKKCQRRRDRCTCVAASDLYLPRERLGILGGDAALCLLFGCCLLGRV